MRTICCFVLTILLPGCGRPVDDGPKGDPAAQRRPLEERVLGNWATSDPGELRGLRFSNGNNVTFVVQPPDGLKTISGKYQLTGRIIEIEGRQGGSSFWGLAREVVSSDENSMTLRAPSDPDNKVQRFTRE